jgi:large subunit ribosomal protein L28
MARGCDFCHKTAVSGNRVSHANNMTKRRWHPNLRSVRAVVEGAVRRVHVCARCLRDGKVVKPLVREKTA